jgi:hypothetical protein
LYDEEPGAFGEETDPEDGYMQFPGEGSEESGYMQVGGWASNA